MATGGLYGQSSAGIVSPQSGSESSGLYGNNTVFGGTYFEWFIFRESATQPATPTGGSWSFTTNTGTAPAGWTLQPPAAPTNQVWVSIALVNSRATATLTWSTPGLFGVVPNFTFPTPITGAAGSNAAVVNSGTATNPILTFTIPRGNTGATGATGPAGPTGPIGITWRGNWSGATAYAVNDGVFDVTSGSSYIAVSPNINFQPPNAAYWNLVAQKGADGGVGVATITGTANQITASASTGAVTLSLPNTINVNTSGNAATATSATNIASGVSNQILYQTNANSTSFIPAPTLSSTFLQWNGFNFVWATSSGANSVVLRDANQNIAANSFNDSFSNIAASGTAITLTASSTRRYTITGSGGQVFTLPDATTLANGAIFEFDNNQSSGAVTVNNHSNTLVVSIPSGGIVRVDLLSNAIAAGSWDKHSLTPANVSWSTNTFDYPGSITNATWNGNVVAYNRGGTGQSSYATGDIIYASATNTLDKLPAGANGYVLTLAEGLPTWAVGGGGGGGGGAGNAYGWFIS